MTITARKLTWTLATLAVAASTVSGVPQSATRAAYAEHVDTGHGLLRDQRPAAHTSRSRGALPRASAGTLRPVVLLNDSGIALTPSTLLSAPFHAAGPVTVAWKVAAADAAGIRSYFVVVLTDAQGHTRARLVATTRAGRASATTDVEWRGTCYLKMSVANMEFAIVAYTLAANAPHVAERLVPGKLPNLPPSPFKQPPYLLGPFKLPKWLPGPITQPPHPPGPLA